ncbi:cytoskeleton protein RodZ [Atopomonas hussainii]|uniref:Cytoskeleton protein RodZ n=1 Tax=Atopomonas hussainii TaxID=1429083 RepID=A0A1H7JTQ4_9GAMM|nr:RodZ domain-containing protein [Atopomonas hussainii]SEK77902.1 cytoskeleton protein RodZ [Atopomonas hussainii]
MSTAVPETPAPSVNPGETLRLAREAKGLSPASVAQSLNLSEFNVRLIEDGAFERLPGLTFARGYVRAYARLLGLDQNRVIVEFDQFTGTTAGAAAVKTLGKVKEPVRTSRSVMRMLTLLVFLLLGVGTFMWWQETQRLPVDIGGLSLDKVEVDSVDGTTEVHRFDAESLGEPVSEMAEAGNVDELADTASELETPQVAEQTPEASAELTSESLVATDTEQTVQTAAESASPTTAQSAPALLAAAEPASTEVSEEAATEPPVLAAGEGRVQIRFSGDCWTQVADAKGKVLVSTLKRQGEQLDVAGLAPLSLILGDASAATVSYNGNAVDLSGYSRGNVARLKVGE